MARDMTNSPEATSRGGDVLAAGEQANLDAHFTADQVSRAFAVDIDRVHNAMKGEFGAGPDATVDNRQAQQLAEVILGDQPLDRREAALMQLGAYTPRSDAGWGVGDNAPGEESDRLRGQGPADDRDRYGSDAADPGEG